MGLKKYGKGDWRNISRNFVTTRTPTQVASHAQKYFIRQLTGGKDKRRSSIHDITTINVPDTKSPSPDSMRPPSPTHSAAATMQPHQHSKITGVVKEHFEWKSTNEGLPLVFNSSNANTNTFLGSFRGVAPYGPKLKEQDLFSNTRHGSQLGPYSTYFKMH